MRNEIYVVGSISFLFSCYFRRESASHNGGYFLIVSVLQNLAPFLQFHFQFPTRLHSSSLVLKSRPFAICVSIVITAEKYISTRLQYFKVVTLSHVSRRRCREAKRNIYRILDNIQKTQSSCVVEPVSAAVRRHEKTDTARLPSRNNTPLAPPGIKAERSILPCGLPGLPLLLLLYF